MMTIYKQKKNVIHDTEKMKPIAANSLKVRCFREMVIEPVHTVAIKVYAFSSYLPSVLVSRPSTSKIASLNSSLSLWISCSRTPFLLRMSSSSERSSGLRSTGTVREEKKNDSIAAAADITNGNCAQTT